MRDQAPVTVRVVYLARLREALGSAGESMPIRSPSDPTVADVLEVLRARGGPYADEFGPGRAFRVAVNHAMARPADPVRDGDEVALFPPVTGG